MKYNVITIGNVALDIFFEIHQNKKDDFVFPLGSKIDVKKSFETIGGSAANVAVGLSRLGVNTGCATLLGTDYISEEIKKQLAGENIEVSLMKQFDDFHSGISCVLLSNFGERTILIHHGIDDYGLIKLPKNLKTKYLFITALGLGWEKIYKEALALACEKNVKLVLNPGNFQLENFGVKIKGVLKNTEILFINKVEAEMLVRQSVKMQVKELLKEIQKLGPKIVVITSGESGADVYDGVNFYHASITNDKRVDTTGAGDAFASGFLAKYILNKNIDEALKWGIKNSGSVVSQIGAQKGLLKLDQI